MLQHSDDSGKTDAVAAIKLWGDKDSIPAIVFVAQKGRIGGSSWAAIDVLGEFKDTRGAAALSEMLEDPSKSTQAKKALTKMGKETAEGEVLKFYNDPDRRARREARLLVHSFETDAALILGQCIADLGTAELARHQGAVEWLATTDKVVEQKRNEVADRLATMLDSKDFSLRENVPKAFAKWATAKHADKMYELLTSRHADVRKNALKTLVVAGHSKLLAPKLNELLKSTLTRKDAIAFLNQVGPSAEDVMIVILLGSEHEDVLMLVCEYLFHHGTKKAQEPLTKFRGIAIKLKKKELSEAASRARAEITKRENAMTEP